MYARYRISSRIDVALNADHKYSILSLCLIVKNSKAQSHWDRLSINCKLYSHQTKRDIGRKVNY